MLTNHLRRALETICATRCFIRRATGHAASWQKGCASVVLRWWVARPMFRALQVLFSTNAPPLNLFRSPRMVRATSWMRLGAMLCLPHPL